MGGLGEGLGGGAGEMAGGAVEGEADEVDFLAAVAVGLGVALFLDLIEGFLRRAVDLELKDKDAFRGLGDQVGATVGLPVFGGDAEGSVGGQQNVEDTLKGELLHAILFGTISKMCVEVGEVTEEGREVGLFQSLAGKITVTITWSVGELLDEQGVERAADLLVRDAEGEA